MFEIANVSGPLRYPLGVVDTIEEARTYLAELGEVIAFEVEPDGTAADAAVAVSSWQLDLYTVEAV